MIKDDLEKKAKRNSKKTIKISINFLKITIKSKKKTISRNFNYNGWNEIKIRTKIKLEKK